MQEVRGSIPLTSISPEDVLLWAFSGCSMSDFDLETDAAFADNGASSVAVQSDSPKAGGLGTFDHSGLVLPSYEEDEPSEAKVDLNVKEFAPVARFFADKPSALFDSPNYYKKVLGGEGQPAHRLHGLLSKYLAAKDPKDKGVFRQQIISAYWELMSHIAAKVSSKECCEEKKATLRYGLILPSLLTEPQKELFATIIKDNETGEAIYYLDEWFSAIAYGKINPSGTDEVKTAGKNDPARFVQLLQKAEGKLQSAENLLRAKSAERVGAEAELRRAIDPIFQHAPFAEAAGVWMPYTEEQKRALSEISERVKKLVVLDRELNGYINEFSSARADTRSLQQKVQEAGAGADTSVVASEFNTVRQMAKMTCGRQGNHFPIVSREYFHSTQQDIGTRENVLEVLRWIESIDVEAFCRVYRSQLNRIPPFVILLPTYGDTGFCWEPFDRYNRVTSRGRIIVPMYGKNLKVAVLTAVADLRWQVAKEKASFYWMEEGLTGNYYQWFQMKKLKGDLKEAFINDYLLWMLKESEGIQKLDKEVRGIFWRYMPFAKDIKEKLKTRALVYQELCQRDANREMSDGY